MTGTTATETIEHLLTDAKDIIAYTRGGNAIFTLVSPTTGNRFTYKMIKRKLRTYVAEDRKRYADNPTYELRLLQGDDNTKDYHFFGVFYPEPQYSLQVNRVWIKDSKRDIMFYAAGNLDRLSLPSHRAIVYLLLEPERYLQKGLQFWTSGRCAKCGRLLTDPASIACGFGPHCGGRR